MPVTGLTMELQARLGTTLLSRSETTFRYHHYTHQDPACRRLSLAPAPILRSSTVIHSHQRGFTLRTHSVLNTNTGLSSRCVLILRLAQPPSHFLLTTRRHYHAENGLRRLPHNMRQDVDSSVFPRRADVEYSRHHRDPGLMLLPVD